MNLQRFVSHKVAAAKIIVKPPSVFATKNKFQIPQNFQQIGAKLILITVSENKGGKNLFKIIDKLREREREEELK